MSEKAHQLVETLLVFFILPKHADRALKRRALREFGFTEDFDTAVLESLLSDNCNGLFSFGFHLGLRLTSHQLLFVVHLGRHQALSAPFVDR